MSYSRVIGRNIELVLNQKGVSMCEFAEKLGYSEMDFHKILEGVLMIGGREIKEIATHLGIALEELTRVREEDEYRTLIHCMGNYEDPENKDRILDYIDMYIELEEAVEV